MLIQNALFNHTALPVLGKSLDAAALRGRAIAANLANVGTPGYERVEVAFESALRQALNSTTPIGSEGAVKADNAGERGEALPVRAQVDRVFPVAFRPKDLTLPGGVNNVDVDMEMAKLAENQIAFEYGVRFVQDRRGAIESAIKGRPV